MSRPLGSTAVTPPVWASADETTANAAARRRSFLADTCMGSSMHGQLEWAIAKVKLSGSIQFKGHSYRADERYCADDLIVCEGTGSTRLSRSAAPSTRDSISS